MIFIDVVPIVVSSVNSPFIIKEISKMLQNHLELTL
jgi:hypothetical protein